MNTKLAALKQRLSELAFARVTNSVAKDDRLLSFHHDGVTWWDDEPGFQDKWASLSRVEQRKAVPSYHFYFGFADGPTGNIHFDHKGHEYRVEDYPALGILTKQKALNPPSRGQWIVGTVVNPERPHFYRWTRCTEAEMVFAKFLVEGKTQFSDKDLHHLYVHRHISDGPSTNRLINMAQILLARNFDYYLKMRSDHGGECADPQVYSICQEYGDSEFWDMYRERALAERIDDSAFSFSSVIPKPAPQPIVERRSESELAPIGLNTPFANLK
ncbi:MAG: hypothetical protein AAB381_00085 [Patescibacteria group bacterium]